MPPGSFHWSSWSDSRRTTVTRVAVALVVLALVAPTAAAATTASGSATPVGNETPGAVETATAPEAAFETGTFEEDRGDVVEFAVSLDGVDWATLRLRGPGGYDVTVELHDEDGDGTVSVSFNTYLAGDGGRAFATVGSDRVLVRTESAVDGPAAAGTYDLSVDAGDDGDPDDAATLHLRERSTDGLAVWSALSSERPNLTDVDGIVRAKRSRGLQRAGQVTMDDLLVVEVRASGLSGALAAQDGPNATARFFELLVAPHVAFNGSEAGIALGANQNASSVGTQEEPILLDFGSHDATTVIPDAANDTYYLIVDLDAVPQREGKHNELRAGDDFDVRFVVGTNSHLANGSREAVTDHFSVVQRRAEISGPDRIYLDPEPNRTIRGRTNVPTGYPVTVTVYAPGEVDFEETREVTVDPDGRFEVPLDLSEVPERTRFGVRVVFRARVLLDDPDAGRVETIRADLDVLDVRNEGYVAVDVNATLGLGGYVVLHANSSDGRVIGRSQYLPPGTHDVTVAGPHSTEGFEEIAVVLHRNAGDGGGEFSEYGDPPYLDDWVPVAATVAVPPESSPPWRSETPASTATLSRTPTHPVTRTPPDADTPTDVGPTVPGFGFLAAMAALLAASLLGAGRAIRER